MLNDLPIRKIIHVDMDAFYASVEQLDRPDLRDKAVIVGHDWGGAVAWVVATRFPARVSTLTVLSTHRTDNRSSLARSGCLRTYKLAWIPAHRRGIWPKTYGFALFSVVKELD